MINRAWKVGDFCCVSDEPSATLYRISEIADYTVHLVYYNLLNGRRYSGGWFNTIALRKPSGKQYEVTIIEHLEEIDSNVT